MNFKRIYRPLLFAAFLTTALTYSAAQSGNASAPVAPIKITSEIDTTTLTMGERTTMHVEVLKNGHGGSVLTPVQQSEREGVAPTIGGVEIRQVDIDSTDLGNNRVQVRYNILLQPFEPNDYVLPPFKYVLDSDTFTSNVIALKVLEPEIPQEMRDSLYINPLRPPMSIKAEWYDWVPDWFTDYWIWWTLGLFVLLLAAAAYILYRKNGKSFFAPKRIIPPYELANQRLDELKRKKLHEHGNSKAYYTELTDILRQYLGGRFHIYALEMTSSQILDEMRKNPETARFIDLLGPMFNIADFVKFAKQTSTVDENIRSFNAVKTFVKETKPVETENDKNNNKTKTKNPFAKSK